MSSMTVISQEKKSGKTDIFRTKTAEAACITRPTLFKMVTMHKHKTNEFLPNGVQPKTLLKLPFFDDPRYFFSYKMWRLIWALNLTYACHLNLNSSKSHQILQVCDLCRKDYRENYQSTNVTKHLIANKAEMIVNISASPWTLDKHDARDRRISLKEESEAAR